MAYTSEIEKLERRWAENPKGRNFAPLADAYRKAGELDRAIELCQSGLELHPDYVSAHIVLGRCLVDMKNDPGAEGVFRKVLELDPENILALRMLSELAERNDRYDEAVQWLGKLLSADPMNGDAAESINRVKSKAAQAASKSTAPVEPVPATAAPEAAAPEPPAEPEPPPVQIEHLEIEQTALAEQPTTAMDTPEFQVERSSGSHPSPEAASPSPELEVFDGALDFGTVSGATPATEGLVLEEPVTLSEADVPHAQLEGLARTQYEGSGVFKVDDAAMPPEPPPEPAETLMMSSPPTPEIDAEFDLEPPASPMSDLPLIMPEDVEPPQPPARRTPPPQPRASAPRTSVPAAVQLSDDDGAADTAALSQAEPVLTETMAELYLQQGHHDDALRVYEALLAERPGDRRLRARVNQLMGVETAAGEEPGDVGGTEVPDQRPAASGQKVADFLRGILRAKPGSAAPSLTMDASGTSTLDHVFAQVPEEEQAAEAPVSVPGSSPGAPTRAASDAISLDSVFGDETGTHATPRAAATEQAAASRSAPAAAASAKPASGGAGGGFSFDEFFSSSPAPASGGAEPAATAPASSQAPGAATPAPRPSGRTPRSQEDEQDLDHFQEWLKGLKA